MAVDPFLEARRAVRTWLVQADRSQAWLARRFHVSEATVSRLLAGQLANANLRTRIAKLTGVDIPVHPREVA